MSGILTPLAGKTISCGSGVIAYAQVDTAGMPYVRLVRMGSDSGWRQGVYFCSSYSFGNCTYSVSLDTIGVTLGGTSPAPCTAYWPLN